MFLPSLYAITALLHLSHSIAQNVFVSLYPTVDPVRLAQAFNVSFDCLDALNTSLPCDPTLFQMANSVDNYYWEADNVTDLCTFACFEAVDAWNDDVQIRCALDSLVAYGKVVPASSVAGRYSEGLKIACLTNQNASDYTDVDPSWCLLESQSWVGSDVIRPDCTTDTSDPSCADPANVSPDNERLANLYSNDVLCSECFIQMMYQRLTSPYLPDHDYSDYLVEQYQDILDVCNATNNMPELVIRVPPNYPVAVPPPLNLNLSGTANTTCSGQTIIKSSLNPSADCNSIAQAFNVATGDVQAATGNANCTLSTPSICLPAPCTLQQTPADATCASLATSFSTTNLNVTTVQVLSWNPHINGLCDSLTVGDYVCASAPGGSYDLPPPPPGSADANGQQRGGGDGSNVGTVDNTTTPVSTSVGSSPSATPSPTQPGNTTVAASPPSPIQLGIAPNCDKYQIAKSGDYCSKFAQDNGISTDNLYAWNSVLGSGGSSCDTQFFLGYNYCIGVST